jgi:LMBR1 domain-containing protein 1
MDVANRTSAFSDAFLSGTSWGVESLPMSDLWNVTLLAIVIMVLGVIPFAIFYYEESGEGVTVQLRRGLLYGGITMVSGCVVITVVFVLGHEASIPVRSYYAAPGMASTKTGTDDVTKINVSLPIFAVACVALVGWVFFSIFAGVGLVALPIDLLNTFRDRPTSIDVKNWAAKRNELRDRASKLRKIGEKMEAENFQGSKPSRTDQKLFNKFRNAVYLLEKDYEILRVRKFEKGGNILYYIGMGILGVVAVFLSILWVLHIILFIFLAGGHPFLNTMLVGLDNVFPLFGTLAFGSFSFYLLWCETHLDSFWVGFLKRAAQVHCERGFEAGYQIRLLHNSPHGNRQNYDELVSVQCRGDSYVRNSCYPVLLAGVFDLRPCDLHLQ